MESVDAVVIGAGVVGLACARALALRGLETIVVERHAAFGTETSSHNSEVIHAGFYYPRGSLKARLCVAGNRQLYAYCASHGIGHRRCGKLVVATAAAQEEQLAALCAQGQANGVAGLEMLSAAQAKELEPQVRCSAALLSRSTGIIDSRALMLALLGDAQRQGAVLALRSPLQRAALGDQGFELELGGAEPLRLRARVLVNAAGLSAQRVAASIEGLPAHHIPPCHWAKGNYYAHTARVPFSRLIYPVPEPGGLGLHLTLDLGGQARFGPDVEWVDAIDYTVDPARADRFYAEVRRYWPGLADGALAPAFCGIRPKLCGPGESAADFAIQGPAVHAVAGLVNLFGIESPGLTASMAIAEHALGLVLP